MPRPRIIAVPLVAACALGLAAAPATTTAQKKKPVITMSGSTSVKPLASNLAKAFLKKRPGAAQFKILQGGSDIGVTDVARGRVTIGNVSRDPRRGDPGGVRFTRIARDGLCIVTNRSNAMTNLSQEQIQAIFSGRVRRWDDVPGAKVSGPISLYVRTAASGTQDAFQNIFLGPSLRVAASASQKQSNGLVQQSVRTDQRGIGYVSFEFTEGTHTVPYRGAPCSLRNAKSGQYGGVRNFYMVTRGAPKGATKLFIDYIRSSAGQKVVAKGWVPLK